MASILVIEDARSVLLSIKLTLEGRGHRVIGAENGARGLDLLATDVFDLVITDIRLPDHSGPELIRAGKMRSSNTRFLAITGGGPGSDVEKDMPPSHNYGAHSMLIKPFAIKEFLSAVSELLEAPV
jgi:DNA-binding NtrC family response regulator